MKIPQGSGLSIVCCTQTLRGAQGLGDVNSYLDTPIGRSLTDGGGEVHVWLKSSFWRGEGNGCRYPGIQRPALTPQDWRVPLFSTQKTPAKDTRSGSKSHINDRKSQINDWNVTQQHSNQNQTHPRTADQPKCLTFYPAVVETFIFTSCNTGRLTRSRGPDENCLELGLFHLSLPQLWNLCLCCE